MDQTSIAPAGARVPLDVQSLLDQRPIGKFQRMLLCAAFCMVALDGFDLTCMGFIAPAMKAQWHLASTALGPVLSAALAGLALGALAAGPVADRHGRRVVLLVSLLVLGAFTLAAASAQDVTQLTAMRFLAGLGMGALLPAAATLVAEFVPRDQRSRAVSLVYCALPASGACGGFLAAWLIPQFGWPSVLLVGGALPLLLLPLFAWKLPESPVFLAARGAPPARIHAIMQAAVPGLCHTDTRYAVPENSVLEYAAGRGAAGLVLSRPYLFGGAMLWVAYFASLFILYLMINWLPTLVKQSGFSLGDAATVTGLFQLGGIAGTLGLGWTMERLGSRRLLAAAYAACALVLFGLGHAAHMLAPLAVLAFLLGCTLTGSSTTINALATAFYPTRARATGTSWMHSAGRGGAILSAFAGAQMLGQGWSAGALFSALALPALCAALAILLQGRSSNANSSAQGRHAP